MMVVPHPTQPSPELIELVHERAGAPGDPDSLAQAERQLLDLRSAADGLLAELRCYLANTDRLIEWTRRELGDPAPAGAPRIPDPVSAAPDSEPEPPGHPDAIPELCACGCRRPVEQSGSGGRRRIWWSDACRKRGRAPTPDTLSTGVIHTPPLSTEAAAAA